MTYSEEQRYWIWLSSIPGITSKVFERLMAEYGEVKYVWEQQILARRLLTSRLYERLKDACNEAYMEKLFSRMEQEGMVAITKLDAEYPYRLRSVEDAPLTLYVRGSTELNDEKMFAIVGSRKTTTDGRHFTRTIARDLAQEQVTVVSGLALGADGAAHEGCLEAGGKTIAVLASGPEFIYPSEHRGLAERILESGGSILSEYPPDVHPDARNFPQRNRIISGMSDGVLMTEGTIKSGAMITVRYAHQQCRPCFAVPGSVYSLASQGTNQMLVDGDMPVISSDQIFDYFGWKECREIESSSCETSSKVSKDILQTLDEPSQKIVEILRFEEKSFDELSIDMKMNSSCLNSVLTILEMQGIIRQSAGKMYRALV